MHTTSGPLMNLTQRLARLRVPLLLVLTLVLAATVVLVVLAADAAGTATAPITVAPFRW